MCLALPGRILSIETKNDIKMAKVDFGGVTREVCISLIDKVDINDYIIVHAGFAINTLNVEEAEELIKLFDQNITE